MVIPKATCQSELFGCCFKPPKIGSSLCITNNLIRSRKHEILAISTDISSLSVPSKCHPNTKSIRHFELDDITWILKYCGQKTDQNGLLVRSVYREGRVPSLKIRSCNMYVHVWHLQHKFTSFQTLPTRTRLSSWIWRLWSSIWRWTLVSPSSKACLARLRSSSTAFLRNTNAESN